MEAVLAKKQELRKKLNSLRAAQSPSEKLRKEQLITKNTISLLKGKTWSIYSPIKGEVDTSKIVEETSKTIEWAYPVVKGEDLEFFIPNGSDFVSGTFGIREPNPGTARRVEQLDGCILPGLAFDRQGYRLGSGKGFYDRFLSTFKGQIVGLAFDFQIQDEVPHEPHDVCMDHIVTEKEVITIGDHKER